MHISHDTPLEEVVSRAHEALLKIRNTQIPSGMHIFGEIPEGEKRIDFINSILRFDSGDPLAPPDHGKYGRIGTPRPAGKP